MAAGWVFGYASLVTPRARPAHLQGHRRVWGVAMDNRIALAGYKVYEAPDGTRPAVDVAFLDLAPDPGTVIRGALLAVGDADLAALDGRERQYRRVEVTAAIDPAPGGPVWTYVGRPESRERVARGRAGAGAVVVQRAYAELVDHAFTALGPRELAGYRATTEAPPFPVLELARVDLPA
ncbi:gamma-glutamylcyclotransferase family protein [Baekduia soli]|nr:gamma-glutamylcyclotransferase family protein [Baekduia soli]